MSLRYRCCLFDFDGTVADTGEGIRRSVAYSLEKMGKPALDVATLSRFIGPPLHDSYMAYCGMSDDEAETAIMRYRERYVDIGLYESHLYPGIAALLKALHEAGACVGIASAKPQFMLERLAAYYEIDRWLDVIVGIGLDRHSADKRDLILRALPTDMDVKCACMVGDRRFDIEAARKLGLGALGVNYGYALPGELRQAGADAVFDSTRDLSNYLLGAVQSDMAD
jgi:phosphoglycolate phosphatase